LNWRDSFAQEAVERSRPRLRIPKPALLMFSLKVCWATGIPSLRSELRRENTWGYTLQEMSFLKFLMLLALIVWIGGIIFFAFVLAPTVFGVLPTTKLAGDVVSATLTKLHWMGLISGVVFLISSLLYNWQKHLQLRPFALSHIFVVLMLVFTMVSQFGITPHMRELRAELQISDVPISATTQRAEFDRLHAWSTRLEGGVLFLGLGVVILTARRFESSN
jgi:uncharacterized membrane protein